MKLKKIVLLILTPVIFFNLCSVARAGTPPAAEDIYRIGVQAYIYGCPLVLMDKTRELLTQRTPINRFGHAPAFPTPMSKAVIRPNTDTLYSSAWLDLSQEPIILCLPDTNGRYYLIQIMDAWTETLAAPGKRTTGTQEGQFVIVGPHWRGSLPSNLPVIKSPTNLVWMIGRIQTNTSADYANVHKIQQGFKLIPLSRWEKTESHQPSPEPAPSQRMIKRIPPPLQVAGMEALEFFKTLAALMKDNPPHVADDPMVADLKTIGMIPGQDFDPAILNPESRQALDRAVHDARIRIMEHGRARGTVRDGWRFNSDVGRYGTDYLTRAAVAMGGLGALPLEEAAYFSTYLDHQGKPLSGENRYRLHMTKEGLPPVKAFWSVTLYNRDGYFAPNVLKRFGLGDRDPLKYNPDGSLDLIIQNENPGPDKESNWLPAPKDHFLLSLRMYWPQLDVLDNQWKPPVIMRID